MNVRTKQQPSRRVQKKEKEKEKVISYSSSTYEINKLLNFG